MILPSMLPDGERLAVGRVGDGRHRPRVGAEARPPRPSAMSQRVTKPSSPAVAPAPGQGLAVGRIGQAPAVADRAAGGGGLPAGARDRRPAPRPEARSQATAPTPGPVRGERLAVGRERHRRRSPTRPTGSRRLAPRPARSQTFTASAPREASDLAVGRERQRRRPPGRAPASDRPLADRRRRAVAAGQERARPGASEARAIGRARGSSGMVGRPPGGAMTRGWLAASRTVGASSSSGRAAISDADRRLLVRADLQDQVAARP